MSRTEGALYHYRCKVLEWLDADTLTVEVDLGFRVAIEQRIRIRGVNAPEVRGKQKPRGEAARSFAMRLAPLGSFVEVKSHKAGEGDKYGRWLADVILRDGRDLAAVLIEAGHAKPWDGQGVKP